MYKSLKRIREFASGHLYSQPKIHENEFIPLLPLMCSMSGTILHEVTYRLNANSTLLERNLFFHLMSTAFLRAHQLPTLQKQFLSNSMISTINSWGKTRILKNCTQEILIFMKKSIQPSRWNLCFFTWANTSGALLVSRREQTSEPDVKKSNPSDSFRFLGWRIIT